jgi:hypothetical protein
MHVARGPLARRHGRSAAIAGDNKYILIYYPAIVCTLLAELRATSAIAVRITNLYCAILLVSELLDVVHIL